MQLQAIYSLGKVGKGKNLSALTFLFRSSDCLDASDPFELGAVPNLQHDWSTVNKLETQGKLKKLSTTSTTTALPSTKTLPVQHYKEPYSFSLIT